MSSYTAYASSNRYLALHNSLRSAGPEEKEQICYRNAERLLHL